MISCAIIGFQSTNKRGLKTAVQSGQSKGAPAGVTRCYLKRSALNCMQCRMLDPGAKDSGAGKQGLQHSDTCDCQDFRIGLPLLWCRLAAAGQSLQQPFPQTTGRCAPNGTSLFTYSRCKWHNQLLHKASKSNHTCPRQEILPKPTHCDKAGLAEPPAP